MKVVASGLHRPNGLAFHNGALYVAELRRSGAIDDIEDNLDNPPKPTLVNDKFPKDEPTAGSSSPSGRTESSMCRSARRATSTTRTGDYAHIRRMNLDGSGMEVMARGVRNTVGFDWHPVTKDL